MSSKNSNNKPAKPNNNSLEKENLELLKEWREMSKQLDVEKIKNASLMGDVSTLTQDCKRHESTINKLNEDIEGLKKLNAVEMSNNMKNEKLLTESKKLILEMRSIIESSIMEYRDTALAAKVVIKADKFIKGIK